MRNQLLLSSSVAAAVALLVSLLSQGGSGPIGATDMEASEGITLRVAELEQEVASLEALLKKRHKRRGAPDKGAGNSWDSVVERAVAAAESREQGAASPGGEDLDDNPDLREKVGRVVREELAQEREQRFEQRFERHAERRATMVANFSADQGLGAESEARLSQLMLAEHEQIADLFRQAREDGTWHEARDEASELKDETDEVLKDLLDEEQLDAWKVVREESGPGGRGKRGG
jgi:hypothetical protein